MASRTISMDDRTYDYLLSVSVREPEVLARLRPGGLLAVDNTLWSGKVADPQDRSSATLALREFNAKLHDDERVAISLVPIGDGLTLALKH